MNKKPSLYVKFLIFLLFSLSSCASGCATINISNTVEEKIPRHSFVQVRQFVKLEGCGLDKETGKVDLRYNPLSVHEDYFIPVRGGESGTKIDSPIIGTAYLAPEPGAKKFVEVGQKIKKGQTIMIVEAMKTMNHVPSTLNGTVSKVLVKDGEPVEFGQPLISVK